MGTAWRTAGWILLGASLILALSLGIRHGFGLFLAPMSSDFGWAARYSPSPSPCRT